MLSDSDILKKIDRQPKRTAGFKQMVRELGVRGDDRRELLNVWSTVAWATGAGGLRPLRHSASRCGKEFGGRAIKHAPRWFRLCYPEANSLDPQLKTRLAGDIFIPPPAVGSAMHGDRVLVEIGNIRPDGRAEGRIVRLIGRAHSTVVGNFHYGNRGTTTSRRSTTKISQEIVIPQGMEIPRSRLTEAAD